MRVERVELVVAERVAQRQRAGLRRVPQRIMAIVREAAGPVMVKEVGGVLGISDQTNYNWRRQHLIDTR